jgi:hypothetical protein
VDGHGHGIGLRRFGVLGKGKLTWCAVPPQLWSIAMSRLGLCDDMLARHRRYVRDHFEDMAEIRDFTWGAR